MPPHQSSRPSPDGAGSRPLAARWEGFDHRRCPDCSRPSRRCGSDPSPRRRLFSTAVHEGRTDACQAVSRGVGSRSAVMTSWVGLAAACGNIVVLVTLVAAVVIPRRSPLARLVMATFAFAVAWLLTAVCDAMGTPAWTMIVGGTVVLMSIAMVIASLHLWTNAGVGGDRQSERRNDEGGGGAPHWPDAPSHGGGGSDPSWWPEFERQLAEYVGKSEREWRQPATPSAIGRR